jgi:hypothetical protein
MFSSTNKSKILFSAFYLNIVARKNSDLLTEIQFGGGICFKSVCDKKSRDIYFGLKLRVELCLRSFETRFTKPQKVHLMDTVALVDDLPSHNLYRGEVGRVHLTDIVALDGDLPSYGLYDGQVGNVVELFDEDRTCRVRFITPEGRDYASVILQQDQLKVLRFRPDLHLAS